jgi:hypothetical protein
MHRPHPTLLAASVLAAALAQPAAAQVYQRPTPSNLPPTQTQAVARPSAPAAPAAPAYAPAPAYGYPGYPVVQGPVQGYYNGVSNVIGAYGQYGIDNNNARLINQQVEQEKIKTRQMLQDQKRYEQSLQPTAEEVRAKERAYAEQRARRDPPLTEILSGTSLNDLLAAIQDVQTKQGTKGPTVPLEKDVLEHINLSPPTNRGPSSLLRRDGTLTYSLYLQNPLFEKERKELDRYVAQAVREVQENRLQFQTFTAVRDGARALQDKVDASAKDLSINDLIYTKREADQIAQAVNLLRDPMAANYFNGKWEAQGKNVAELVDYMSRNALVFAPAAERDQAAYQVLYRSFVTYDYGLR